MGKGEVRTLNSPNPRPSPNIQYTLRVFQFRNRDIAPQRKCEDMMRQIQPLLLCLIIW
jgi:hypothetical protein